MPKKDKKEVESRYYKIFGFKDMMDGTIRVLLSPYKLVENKPQPMNVNDMMNNPFGFAQNLMQDQMNKVIQVHDTFLISRDEYFNKRYLVGEIIKVTLEKTDMK